MATFLDDIKDDIDTIHYGKTPVFPDELANKKYVDDNAGGGGGITTDYFYRSSAFYHGGTNLEYIPLAGGATGEVSSLQDYTTDDSNFICPYDLKITKVYIQATRANSTSAIAGNTTMRLYKDGSALSGGITVDMSTIGYNNNADTYTVYTFDFSGETNTYSAGDILQISIDPTLAIFYVTATVVGEYT